MYVELNFPEKVFVILVTILILLFATPFSFLIWFPSFSEDIPDWLSLVSILISIGVSIIITSKLEDFIKKGKKKRHKEQIAIFIRSLNLSSHENQDTLKKHMLNELENK